MYEDSDFPAPSREPLPTDKARSTARVVSTVALVLLIIGGLNWALVGLFNLDFVAALFGRMTLLSRGVYIVVGVAALFALTLLPRLGRGRL